VRSIDFGYERSKVKVSRLTSVRVYAHCVTTLYLHSLDGATICCRPRVLIAITLCCCSLTYLFTYLLGIGVDGRGHSGLYCYSPVTLRSNVESSYTSGVQRENERELVRERERERGSSRLTALTHARGFHGQRY